MLDPDAYHVKINGSGCLSKRNLKFLNPFVPYASVLTALGLSWQRTEDIVNNKDTVIVGDNDVQSTLFKNRLP